MAQQFQFGLDTFGDITLGPDGSLLSQAEVIRNVVEEAVLADALGVDFFGVGEHHRADFAVSAPEVVLAAIAGRTRRIRLGSAVTVLSSDDPIRVFQRFSTLDAVSNGRAEVILGRGSFTESFPLFGYELSQYEELFEEKLDLFAALLRSGTVTWHGRTRPPLTNQRVYPPIETRIAEDLDRRRRQSGIGRPCRPLRHAADARHHRRRSQAVPALCRSVSSRLRAARQARAADRRPLAWLRRRNRRAGARGILARLQAHARPDRRRARLGPDGRAEFDREVEHGSLYVGSPETVARKIAATAKALGISRFDLKYSAGALSHDKLMRGVELYGSKVVPLVREMLA